MSGLASGGAQPVGQDPSDPRANAIHGNGHADPDGAQPALSIPDPGVALFLAGSGSSDVAIGDWDELFSAVEARLTSTVDGSVAVQPEESAALSVMRVRASVLECVAALHQLHSTGTHELARHRRLVRDLTEPQTGLVDALIDALANARAEIARLHARCEPPHAAHAGEAASKELPARQTQQ